MTAGSPAGAGPGHATAPPSATVDLRVRYAETDQMGVVYHANYLIWCEIGRTELIRTLGLPYAELERTAGILLAVADASIRYHASARYDDPVRVLTTLADVRSRTITFDYLITNADSGARLVTARTTLVCLDRSGRPVTLPAPLRELFGQAST
jgi:acyl-CoA thioester hydrolase